MNAVAPKRIADPSPVMLLRWIRSPLAVMEEGRARIGDAFGMKLPGFPVFYLLSDPDAIKDIFTGNPMELPAGKANEILRPLLGETSLLLLDGERHLRERRLMLPAFHGERMQAYAETMVAVTRERLARWQVGRELIAHREMQTITLDIILQTVFGVVEGVQPLHDAVTELLDILSRPLWMLPWFQVNLGRLTPWARAEALKVQIDTLLFRRIAAARQSPRGQDILSMLLDATYEDGSRMNDFALRDEMMTLLVAGHETTASTMAWAMYHLLRHPEALARASEDPAYLEACIKETLRLTPVIPLVGRVLEKDTRAGAHMLPKGSMAAPCVYLTHRNPRVWEDPDSFRPERFLNAKITPYQFLAFGGGARRCIGAAFSLYEMKIVLGEMLKRRWRLRPGYTAKIVRRAITFVPSGGVPIILED